MCYFLHNSEIVQFFPATTCIKVKQFLSPKTSLSLVLFRHSQSTYPRNHDNYYLYTSFTNSLRLLSCVVILTITKLLDYQAAKIETELSSFFRSVLPTMSEETVELTFVDLFALP